MTRVFKASKREFLRKRLDAKRLGQKKHSLVLIPPMLIINMSNSAGRTIQNKK